MLKRSGYKVLARKRRQQSRKTRGLVRIVLKKKKRGKGQHQTKRRKEIGRRRRILLTVISTRFLVQNKKDGVFTLSLDGVYD